MKSILRLALVVVSACALSACGGGKGKGHARSPDSERASKGGCPDEDPFCKDKGGAVEDEVRTSESRATKADESAGEGSSGAATPGKSPESVTDEVVVIKVAKPPAEAKDKDAKDGKDAKAAKDKKPAAKGGKQEPPKTATVVLWPKGISWGMGSEQIAKVYDRLFDAQYTELYKRTPVGPQTEALDNELQEKKRLLRQNKLVFGNMPTGMDNTSLKREFTYQNNESMTKIDLGNAVVRNFFFFGDRLWKIYDEHTMGKSPVGNNWEAAVLYIGDKLGTKPKMLEPGAGHDYAEAEWNDGTTIVRLINRDFQQVVGVLFIQSSVQGQLPTLRKNRKQDLTAVDSSVANATRPKAPPPEDKKKKAAAKKK